MALQSDNLILRQETNPDLTTKNAELTFQELDENFIFIYEDLKALQGSGALPAWVVRTTYSLNTVVSYDGFIWKYVNASPSSGVVPGSDPLFWVQLSPTELTHVQNSDTKLGEGTADEVSANEIRTFLDTPIVTANLYNDDGSLSDNRQVNLNGKTLIFFGTNTGTEFSSTVAAFGLKGYSNNNGVIGQGDTGVFGQGVTFGVKSDGTYGIYSTGQFPGLFVPTVAGGIGIEARQGAGLFSGKFTGNGVLIENDSTSSLNASSILELASINKGSIPFPVMTTTQKNAIASPATGLFVFDSTTNRPEFYNGSNFRGLATRFINISHAAYATPAGGAQAHFGCTPIAPQTERGVLPIFNFTLRGNGVISGCNFVSWASGTAGSNESWEVYILINNTTAYLVAAVSSTSPVRIFNNSALNIPFVDGDVFRMYYKNPASWVTVPTQVFGQGTISLQ